MRFQAAVMSNGFVYEPTRKVKHSLFESFLPYFEAASWPTYSSMSIEAASKSDKKSFKKSNAFILLVGS